MSKGAPLDPEKKIYLFNVNKNATMKKYFLIALISLTTQVYGQGNNLKFSRVVSMTIGGDSDTICDYRVPEGKVFKLEVAYTSRVGVVISAGSACGNIDKGQFGCKHVEDGNILLDKDGIGFDGATVLQREMAEKLRNEEKKEGIIYQQFAFPQWFSEGTYLHSSPLKYPVYINGVEYDIGK